VRLLSERHRVRTLGLCVALGAGCGPIPQMVMPDVLENDGDTYAVSGANAVVLPFLIPDRVEFGPWRIRAGSGVNRGNMRVWSIFDDGPETSAYRQKGWFTLHGPQSDWRASCILEEHDEIQHHESFEFSNHGVRTLDTPEFIAHWKRFECELRSNGVHWKLEWDLDSVDATAGTLTSTEETLTFGPTFEQRYQPFGRTLAGYVISDESGPIGAVDTGGRKRVTLRHALDPPRRELVAAVCAAVLSRRLFR
jgi:hypothetical protein